MRFLITILIVPTICLSQARMDNQQMLDRIAEEVLATAEADINYDELYETLTHLLASPVDLNTVTKEQLRATMILNEKEVNALLEYRDECGKLLNTLELQAIPGWSTETVQQLLPFVFVRDPSESISPDILERIAREKNQYVVLRFERTLEEKPGYHTQDLAHRYAGSPDRYYFRYRMVRSNDFSLGLTAEKDPGELIQWSPPTGTYGFDFYSGHIQLMRKGLVENLVVGDFQCQFGQGLQLGSAFGLGKTAQAITGIRRSNIGFLPYVSASESYYFRGIASTLRIAGPVRLHLFGSSKSLDASVEPGDGTIRALQTSGLHRTSRELAARGTVTERDLGTVLQFRRSAIDFGIVAHRTIRSSALMPGPTPYSKFRPTGGSHTNLGFYLNYGWAGLTFFAEYARSVGYGSAVSMGLLGNVTQKLEMAWLFRHFDVNYHAAYANALSENSTPENEQGFYWGTKYSFSKRLSIQGYLDYFRFPWLRYRAYKPSDGTEILLRLDWSPRRDMRFYIQAREEVKVRNLPDEGLLYRAEPGTRRNIWVGGEHDLTEEVTLKTKIQASSLEVAGVVSLGLALSQEATWKRGPFALTLRCAVFDTDDYENRQYLYEKDVWLATSLPAFEGKGVRNYFLAHYAVTRWLDIWLRWSRTLYFDRTAIGSGMDRIAGNARNDIKFQLRIRP